MLSTPFNRKYRVIPSPNDTYWIIQRRKYFFIWDDIDYHSNIEMAIIRLNMLIRTSRIRKY